jgi:hypothetical protein
MRTRSWSAILVATVVVVAGCHGTPSSRSVASSEPVLDAPAGSTGSLVVEAPPPKTVAWVDRHPLFSRPREYYDKTGKGPVAKVAAATVIGVPSGIVGEIRQLVVGRPPEAPPF